MSRALALLVVLLIVSGCATRSSHTRLRSDVAAVRADLTDLRQAQDATARELARAVADHRALQASAAEVDAALRERAVELGRLRARLEAAERDAQLAKTPALSAAPAPSPPVSAPSAPAAPVAPPAMAPPPPPAPRPREPAPRTPSPEQAYGAALATFRTGEHGQAVLDFLDFIAKHRQHALAANAQYWIGEAYYAQRDYRQAVAEFQKVLQMAPSSRKAADALLKIGLAHRRLRDEARARASWQRVVREFPKSEAAAKATRLLGAP
jgi:tol-pal system protein YbgF